MVSMCDSQRGYISVYCFHACDGVSTQECKQSRFKFPCACCWLQMLTEIPVPEENFFGDLTRMTHLVSSAWTILRRDNDQVILPCDRSVNRSWCDPITLVQTVERFVQLLLCLLHVLCSRYLRANRTLCEPDILSGVFPFVEIHSDTTLNKIVLLLDFTFILSHLLNWWCSSFILSYWAGTIPQEFCGWGTFQGRVFQISTET